MNREVVQIANKWYNWYMFVLICIILTATFSYALLEEYRYRNSQKDIQRDLKREFIDKNTKK